MQEKPYIDYYNQHNIIPVNQDLSDLDKHFRRRSALYKTLGIVPALVRGHSVLEFGPGSGDNAVYTASLQPEKYVLVDGNSASVEAIENKISSGQIQQQSVEIIESDILKFSDDRKFDIVLCEGLIPGQRSAKDFTRHIASFAGDGGCVVITTQTAVSLFPEICRRMMKPFLIQIGGDLETQIEHAIKVFSPHLATLPGVSRKHRDWVLDEIMHPWSADRAFTIPDAIDALVDEFDAYGVSPKFFSDWRWYKAINEKETGWNELAKIQYYQNLAAFLDYRANPDDIKMDNANVLDEVCTQAYDCHVDLWKDDNCQGIISEFLPLVEKIAKLVEAEIPSASSGLYDYLRGMELLANGEMMPDMGSFIGLFGRGQQYLSFLRKS